MQLVRAAATAGLGLVLFGCQGSPAPGRPAVVAAAARSAEELAAEALGRGDYAEAAELYQKAVAQSPERLPPHYGLGVASTYLDRRADVIREFTWVVEHGDRASDEVRAARAWLRQAGALPPESTEATPVAPEETKGDQPRATAALHGRMTFGTGPGDVAPLARALLFLHDYPNRVVYLRIRTDEQGNFTFPKVPPGTYMLTDRAAGPPRWRLRVELKAGADVTLNLDPSNSTASRDDFPGSSS